MAGLSWGNCGSSELGRGLPVSQTIFWRQRKRTAALDTLSVRHFPLHLFRGRPGCLCFGTSQQSCRAGLAGMLVPLVLEKRYGIFAFLIGVSFFFPLSRSAAPVLSRACAQSCWSVTSTGRRERKLRTRQVLNGAPCSWTGRA